MTIPSTPRKAGPLLGTGSQTAWPFAFKVFTASDVRVAIADSTGAETTLTSNYSVALNANQETSPGGTVTYPVTGTALPVGSVLSIVGDTDYDQGLDLPSGGNFSPLALENQLDRSTMQIQQLREELARAARLPVTSSADAESLVADMIRLADSADNIDTVAGSISNVNAVAGNAANINTVAANVGAVAATAANITVVAAVGADLLEPVSEINTVAASIANVNAVGNAIANVNTVAGAVASVNTVAGIAADVQVVANNVADVTNFADVYQGPKAVDPTLRNDGSALQSGDLYFNTTENALRAYSGTVWVAGTAGAVSVQTFSGDGVTVDFTLTTAPSSENNTQVYIGGIYQQKNQYALVGATLTFSAAPPLGTDNVEVVTVSSLALGETDAALVSYTPPAGVVRTVDKELDDLPINARRHGAVANGVTDATTALNAALASASSGATVVLPSGTLVISAPLVVPAGVLLVGQGIGKTLLSCATAMSSSQAAIYTTGSNVRLRDFSILGNTNGTNGAGSGIHAKSCAGFLAERVYVENTTQAGIRLEEVTHAKVKDCVLSYCGRTGYADNHGVMIYTTTSAPCADVEISGCAVSNPFRKAIATYTANVAGGTISGVRILKNQVVSGGLGGIYVGGSVISLLHSDVVIAGNYCLNNYNHIEAGGVTGLVIQGNTLNTSAAQSVYLEGCTGGAVLGNTIINAGTTGIDVELPAATACTAINISDNTLTNCNRSNAGYAPAINLTGILRSTINGNTILDTGTAKTTYGIIENGGGSDFNTINDNNIINVANAAITLQGSNSSATYNTPTGFGVLGGITLNEQTITLVNGQNDNVNLPARSAQVILSGPTSAYSISSIAGGSAGRRLTLCNYGNQTLTLLHASGSASPSGNRFVLPNNANITVTPVQAVELVWSAQVGGWLKVQ